MYIYAYGAADRAVKCHEERISSVSALAVVRAAHVTWDAAGTL